MRFGYSTEVKLDFLYFDAGGGHRAAANALKQVEFNIGVTVGPLLAGVIVAGPGYATAYALDALSFGASMWAVLSLPPMPPAGGGRRAGTASVLEGLAFLQMVQRKIHWMQQNADRLIELAAG